MRLFKNKIIFTYIIMSNSAYYGDRCFRKNLPKTWNNVNSVSDRRMGDDNERYVSAYLKKWFPKNSFTRDTTGWNAIDYLDNNGKIAIELKSRRIRSDRYETIMIGKNKYDSMIKYMKKGFKGYFLFKFTDKLMIFEIPKILPQDICFAKGGTNKRGRDEYSKCMYIPTKYLIDCKEYDNYETFIENKNV